MAYFFGVAYALFLCINKVSSEASACTVDNECVPLAECNPAQVSSILYPCHSGLNLYCCPTQAVKNASVTALLNRRKELFPVNCGVISTNNKITGGQTADLGQFPWMALLGYQQNNIDIIEYLCGGTLITDTYVMTAAHCLGVSQNHKLVLVRLGEHDLRSKEDCRVVFGVRFCAQPPVDVPVDGILKHQNYDGRTLKNDIALVKVKPKITFTDFVQPICLPFGRNLENKDLSGQSFTISGWGKTDYRNVGGSPVLQFTSVSVWNQSSCSQVMPPEVQPIISSQLCAIGKKEDSCKGDSGGPLQNDSLDTDGEVRTFQIGIVSFASTMACGIEGLPPIYTRVDNFLEWIIDNIK